MENFIEMNDDKLSTQLKHPKEVHYSRRKEKILGAVITWFTRDDRPEDREGLLERIFSESAEKATEYQLKIKRYMHEFLPALFENHDDSTFADKSNRTPIHYCISKMEDYCRNHKSADCELAAALCNSGESAIALDCCGFSPLGIALSKRRMDVVEVFISFGSKNVADRNNRGQTILHVLIMDKFYNGIDEYKKYHMFVMELLDKGADVNQPDQDGVTPVHLAAKNLDIGLLQNFKINGANLNCRTNRGDDLLIIICKISHGNYWNILELINYLVDLPDFCVNGKNNNGFTALHYAARSVDIGIIKRLIRAGVDVHAVANDDTNALHSAAASNNFEVMQHLINQNVDFRRRDNVYGFSLIHMAVLSGDPKKCEWLVKEKGFDVDDLGMCQLTPLHLASMLRNAEVVKKLIELGADVHCTDDKLHYSALHLAFVRRYRFSTLRDFRADGGEMTDDHSSIVDHCFNYHRLFDPEADYDATIVALLGAGAEVNATDIHGCTALHYAARHSLSNDTVAILLKAGAHVDVQDNKYTTPLANSFFSNNFHGLKKLLAFGANIDDIAHLNGKIYQRVTEGYSASSEIVEHLLTLKIAGLPIDERFKDILDNFGSNYLKKQSDLSAELTKMKERMLTDEVSLYDLLHMSFRRRSTFANSLTREIQYEFPNYSVILKGRCNEAVNRMPLFEPAREAFKWMTGMPDICIDNILSFMSNLSLRVLIDSASLVE